MGMMGALFVCGSSPLTRGKPMSATVRTPAAGLIPAHAGKTTCSAAPSATRRAHPRSRGENTFKNRVSSHRLGSSPLTRGKRFSTWVLAASARLIPAHAGKTFDTARHVVHRAAHPRSRGENRRRRPARCASLGSSPLTRGKPRWPQRRPRTRRLIPAHAGKTPAGRVLSDGGQAHPRSRGENSVGGLRSLPQRGSSPLTRGKLKPSMIDRPAERLIPAHAGKTLPDLRFYCADRSDLGNP